MRKVGGGHTIASARSIISKKDTNLLKVHGGHIYQLNYGQTFLERLGFVKRKRATKVQVDVTEFELLKQEFVFKVRQVIKMDEIPSQLGIPYIPVSERTMEKGGVRRVAIAGISDKRQITAVFAGDFLSLQFDYQGKTKRCVPVY